MPIYYEITDAQVNPNAPVTSRVGYQLRDNSLAIPAGQVDPAVAPLAPTVIREVFPQGSGTWTVPDHVFRVRVTLMGAGGGGGGAFSNGVDAHGPAAGGGGSGGLVIAVLAVEPGQDYDWVVGARGTGGAGGAVPAAGTNGALTSFGLPAGQELWAPGGEGGGTRQGGLGGAVGTENAGPPFLTMLDLPVYMAGAPGGHGSANSAGNTIGGNGASSHLNGGGRGGLAAAGQDAPFAVNFGGGAGGGGGGTSTLFEGFGGGDGNNGYIILEY